MLTPHILTARHLTCQERLPFTATYFGSIALTLYFALGVSPQSVTLSGHQTIAFQTILYIADPARFVVVEEYDSYLTHVHRATGRVAMVPRELLPHGLDGAEICGEVWYRPRCGLDGQLIANVHSEHKWLLCTQSVFGDVKQHFVLVAVSTNRHQPPPSTA